MEEDNEKENDGDGNDDDHDSNGDDNDVVHANEDDENSDWIDWQEEVDPEHLEGNNILNNQLTIQNMIPMNKTSRTLNLRKEISTFRMMKSLLMTMGILTAMRKMI